MPEAKRREKLRIWRPGAVSRAGGAWPEKSEARGRWSGRIPGFQRVGTQIPISGLSNVPNGDSRASRAIKSNGSKMTWVVPYPQHSLTLMGQAFSIRRLKLVADVAISAGQA